MALAQMCRAVAGGDGSLTAALSSSQGCYRETQRVSTHPMLPSTLHWNRVVPPDPARVLQSECLEQALELNTEQQVVTKTLIPRISQKTFYK